jgi:sugar phosphate isomerase/epimerase
MRCLFLTTLFIICNSLCGQTTWVRISSEDGAIEVPNKGKQQTSCTVADFDNDGINDFCISERTSAPGLVWYQRTANGWKRQIVEDAICFIEAGTIAFDVDNDGDMDIIAGGEGKTNQLWWWENPYPDFSKPAWPRYLIRNSGGNKVHDQMVGDFDGDFKPDLVFWAQGDQTLYFSRIPSDPYVQENWKLIPAYKYFGDSQMEQHGTYPGWKRTNEHEGLAKADIDGDGIQDIIGGGYWFKYLGNDKFSWNVIDGAYTFSRSAAGQLIPGGRPEVVLVVGDGLAPMYMYEYKKNTWVKKELVPQVSNGHTLAITDFDGDGNQDIWYAEMTLGGYQDAVNRILFGDGNGNFLRDMVVSKGLDVHDSDIADLDGDGDLDILAKPYDGGSPRLDVFLQNGTGPVTSARTGSFSQPFGLQMYSLRFELQKDVEATIGKVADMGIRDVEISGFYGKTVKEFKAILDKNKIRCGSMIFGYDVFEKDPASIIKDAKLFGAKYVGIGWIPHTKPFGEASAIKAASDFNRFGAAMKKAGLRFFYHPHGYEFNTADGNMMDLLLEKTDPTLVTYELDVFWMIHGGGDPSHYLTKYPGRFELMHLKELRRDVTGNNTGSATDETSVALGRGVTNWPALLRLARKHGVKKYYIEDEAKDAIVQVPLTVSYLNSLR